MKLAGFRHLLFIAFVPLMALCFPRSALAQPAPLAPPQLDQLVARIALYHTAMPSNPFTRPRTEPGLGWDCGFAPIS